MSDLINRALSVYGLTEIKGEQDNPKILEMFKAFGHEWVKDDETAWCSAFVNWVAISECYHASMKLNARSWTRLGNVVDGIFTKPRIGDVVVFWRESQKSWKGHVGFYISENEHNIFVLGGNQGNKVQISEYPKNRLLSIRRLIKIDK